MNELGVTWATRIKITIKKQKIVNNNNVTETNYEIIILYFFFCTFSV